MLHHVVDNQHTQNIQMNKVIGENEKCVLYFMEKLNRLFGRPNIYHDALHYFHYTLISIHSSTY